MKRISYVVEYLPRTEASTRLGCIQYFLLVDKEVIAAITPLEGLDGGDPAPHPTYGVTKLSKWPPGTTPTTYVSVRNLKSKCVVVYLVEGEPVAHITSYVHKVIASPSKWHSAFAL